MSVGSILYQISKFTLDFVTKGDLILFFRRSNTVGKDVPGLVGNVDSQVWTGQYQEYYTSVVFELKSLTSCLCPCFVILRKTAFLAEMVRNCPLMT